MFEIKTFNYITVVVQAFQFPFKTSSSRV